MPDKITLNYKASNIAKAEDKIGKNFLQCVSDFGGGKQPGFNDLRFLVIAGGGTDDDFDKLFASGIENLMMTILEGFNNAGFLGDKKIDIEGIKSDFRKTMAQAQEETKTSPSSGAETK